MLQWLRHILSIPTRLEEQERRVDALTRALQIGGVVQVTTRGYPIVSAKSFTRVYPNGCPDPEVYKDFVG